ncbi:MAG: Holliday junction branch migration protein RuvA [Alkaliphilus sp.]
MFDFIRGRIHEINNDQIVIEVNGIGYKINSSITSTSSIKIGEETMIYTNMVVREDGIRLYGFVNKEELNFFNLLLTVSKIGPKVASAVLSTFSPSKLSMYILNKDFLSIARAPGIGQKTAERIVLELKDKVEKLGLEHVEQEIVSSVIDSNEVLEALMALGYSRFESTRAIKSTHIKNASTSELIKKALNFLAK